MEIVKIKIEDLKPYKNNAKIHTDEQIEQIVKSIEQFGMNDPIAVWGDDNLIVEGHGRLEALKRIGAEDVDCIRLDHLTNDERKAYTLAHNKLTMNTDFDFNILNLEIEEIDGIDMADFGFDVGTYDSDEYGTEFELASGDREPIITMSITLSDDQAERVNEAISLMKQSDVYKNYEDEFNKNSNGNALYLVVEEWLQQRT